MFKYNYKITSRMRVYKPTATVTSSIHAKQDTKFKRFVE
jgi:hypothetical protein